MAVCSMMACQFSEDGKYFSQLTSEGKVKIWNTYTNTFEQEFTPDFHLTSPCTCLHFISLNSSNKLGSPRKKKRKEPVQDLNACIALGTSSGRLLIYSLTKGDLAFVIDSATSQTINCLSSSKDERFYSGTDSNILVWNLYKRNIISKWATGNDKVVAILAIPESDRLLTASKSIKLWSISSQEVLKSFTGHSSLVTLLHYVPKDNENDGYVISGSKGDRLLSCWSLNEDTDGKNAVASFLMEDIVNYVSVNIAQDGSTHIATTIRSGVVHVYQHILNGKKSTKPVKPKTTIQVVLNQENNEVVSPIYISAATYRDPATLCICYGSSVVQTFEDLKVSTNKKLQCLLREDVHKTTLTKSNQISKTRTPVVGNDVHYLASGATTVPTKRKNDGQQEIPMEKRLENLMVNDVDNGGKVPKGNNVAQLLIQGLHSKDKNILRTVLFKKDEQLIKNTIKRIPVTLISPLFQELTKLVQGKTLARQIGLVWLKNLITIHSGLLLSNPELPAIFSEALGSIEANLALQTPRNKLMGRLELLVSQISQVSPQETEDHEPLLIFNDKVSSDSDNDEMEFEDDSNSENEWDEESNDDDNEDVKMNESDNENEVESDEDMSS